MDDPKSIVGHYQLPTKSVTENVLLIENEKSQITVDDIGSQGATVIISMVILVIIGGFTLVMGLLKRLFKKFCKSSVRSNSNKRNKQEDKFVTPSVSAGERF